MHTEDARRDTRRIHTEDAHRKDIHTDTHRGYTQMHTDTHSSTSIGCVKFFIIDTSSWCPSLLLLPLLRCRAGGARPGAHHGESGAAVQEEKWVYVLGLHPAEVVHVGSHILHPRVGTQVIRLILFIRVPLSRHLDYLQFTRGCLRTADGEGVAKRRSAWDYSAAALGRRAGGSSASLQGGIMHRVLPRARGRWPGVHCVCKKSARHRFYRVAPHKQTHGIPDN